MIDQNHQLMKLTETKDAGHDKSLAASDKNVCTGCSL